MYTEVSTKEEAVVKVMGAMERGEIVTVTPKLEGGYLIQFITFNQPTPKFKTVRMKNGVAIFRE